ncbi:MAG: DEAD/DEAH box helicase [Propionibacteriaceae bacterium]|nr:DEAD/DEAH box helicase [Propionibacteriaceae bacterium]
MTTIETMTTPSDPLARFASPTRTWFRSAFDAATPVQTEAWEKIGLGEHVLVISPTGSGKTLAAFLHSIDHLMTSPQASPGVRILYVSALKALGVDVERNLRIPLAGIASAAVEEGIPTPNVRVGIRSGDTSSSDRRRLITHPPEILITTPESLFLMLSSSASAILSGIETVIIDEIHYLAGNKRGAHLAVSLERLDALNVGGGMQRIGLSATVRPADRVARFLVGRDRPVTIVAPPMPKNWKLEVVVPVEDMTNLTSVTSPSPAGKGAESGVQRPSMWPHIEQQVFDLVISHRSTICFCNSRAVAERLTSHLNSLYREKAPLDPLGVIARTHHGSISKTLRAEIEDDLKQGRLPCVVATNSLELGIDMGAVDLVIQVGTPPSVASGLQRIGRGGHRVSAVSHGVLFPLSRSDLLATAVVTQRMSAGQIEPVPRIVNPLDVLAQQIVSMCLDTPLTPKTILSVVRRADCFIDLPEKAFDEVVDMLTGKYPDEEFSGLRPRLVRDPVTGTLIARPGARRLVTTSGGTIPDRGLYAVFMAGGQTGGSGKHAVNRRVGELDEEMVYESRVGDVFTLGTSAWRIEEITANQVVVSPAPGLTGKLPFWRSDEMSRSVEVGRQIQRLVADLGKSSGSTEISLDQWSRSNLEAYVMDQRAATGVLPDHTTIVVEQGRDEMGAWRVCVHCQLGKAVLQPWALAIQNRWRHTVGNESSTPWAMTVTDDGITIRLGEVADPRIGQLLGFDPEEIESVVSQEAQRSSLFAAHFRQCSARALLLPKRQPGQRSPLWQQRLRSAQLLGVAAEYPEFPIMAEALRECLYDVFDLDSLRQLMRDIAARRVKIVEVETKTPSPFASSMLFGYTGQFLYNDDQPLAEKAVASMVDPELLASLTGVRASLAVDEQVVADFEQEAQRLKGSHRARSMEALWDVIREIGPLTEDECRARSSENPASWLSCLKDSGRLVALEIGGQTMIAVAEDESWLTRLPGQEAVTRLVARWVRHHGITVPPDIADRFGLDLAQVLEVLDGMADAGSVVAGQFVGTGIPGTGIIGTDLTDTGFDDPDLAATGLTDSGLAAPGLTDSGLTDSGLLGTGRQQYMNAEVLALLRRRTMVDLRAKVQPVKQEKYASFLTRWHEVDRPGHGTQALLQAVDLLAGYPIPASMLDSVVLPSRVTDYQPSMLDQAMASGEVTWSGHGAIGETDGWVCLWPADIPPLVAAADVQDLTAAARRVYQRLADGGAWSVDDLSSSDSHSVDPSPDDLSSGDLSHDDSPHDDLTARQVEAAIWELVWAGLVASDTLSAVRAASQGTGVLRRPTSPRVRRVMRPVVPRRSSLTGRWFAIGRDTESTPTTRALVDAVNLELSRYGIVTKGSILSEAMTPVFYDVYRILAAMEGQGSVRRGYFVDQLGAAQFAVPGAVDRLREDATSRRCLLAACDPANPWGAGLPWPQSQGHRPARRAGAIVVLDNGWPVIYLEKGAHTIVSFDADMTRVEPALRLVGDWVDRGRLGTITVTRINSQLALEAREWMSVLEKTGFSMSPQGFRRRPSR